jgi:glycosyltransferase involved in cell wall biosynthesis
MTLTVLTIVIPAYNEADNLGPVLDDTLLTVARAARAQPCDIIVVNDGSTDHTGKIADEYSRRVPFVRVFHHATNQGLGIALRTGFTNSRGNYVSWISADGQVNAAQVVKLLSIADGFDFITTTRLGYEMDNRYQGRPFFRMFLTWCMHVFCRLCIGIYPKHFTGIYMVRGEYLRSIPLRSQTGLVGMELYCESLRRKAKLRHGECMVGPRLSGRSKVATPMGVLKSVLDMLRMGLSRVTTNIRR